MGISEKKIEDLRGLKFNVPSYQRGYRWTEYEVTTLLDDFYNHNTDYKYCLQPLIVKKVADGTYDVVDGQQRLTSIYIFLKFMSAEFNNGRRRTNQYDFFDLEYETRKQSGNYLKNLNFDTYEEIENIDIDASHISKAFEAIDKWVNREEINSINALNDIYKVLTENVFFIWYEIDETEEPIKIFTKVNIGKIPLTNAELIKALILDKNNYKIGEESDRIHRSIAWNQIEHRLQQDSFWQFLTNNEVYDTKIDFLFNLLIHGNSEEYKVDKYSTFYSLYEEYKGAENKSEFISDFWSKVQRQFEELNNWYLDLNKYHLIGYLLSLDGKNLDKVFKATRDKKKSEAFYELKKLAFDTIPEIDSLDELVYGDKRIKNVLLLFNLVTLINKSEKQYRFPFDIYKTQKWDIEHIHATADETAESDDGLGNLTLLDAKTNRSYRDSPFEQKRKIIIDVDAKGRFVPVCTRNIFLKVYSDEIENFEVWSDNDKTDYIKAMKLEFNKFFGNDGEKI
ncbi:DUF262 domain-containing protein [Streptococcus parasanguinis]|uniref:DUF262 domain-containing protein n=1 Tax=Streptococcus parasanguinis TaxID=1318 RepID=UPI0039C0920A